MRRVEGRDQDRQMAAGAKRMRSSQGGYTRDKSLVRQQSSDKQGHKYLEKRSSLKRLSRVSSAKGQRQSQQALPTSDIYRQTRYEPRQLQSNRQMARVSSAQKRKQEHGRQASKSSL